MKSGLPEVFCSMFPRLKMVAYSKGYMLAVHGSMARDFDLIAVPWIKKAVSHRCLLNAICSEVGGMKIKNFLPEEKPHGRIGYVITMTGSAGYIDISIMNKH